MWMLLLIREMLLSEPINKTSKLGSEKGKEGKG
jgi:hypothetical protein